MAWTVVFMFKRNYSKKPMDKTILATMIIGIIAISLFFAGELASINNFHDSSMKKCLKSLNCNSDLECFELAVEKCSYPGEFKAY